MIKTILIGFFGLILAILAGSVALGSISQSKAPQVALSLKPVNGFAAAKASAQNITAAALQGGMELTTQRELDAYYLARTAFIQEPVTPRAIAVIALTQPERARGELMKLGYELSRREPLISAWMIETNAKEKDLFAVLQVYDNLLRTNASTRDAVIPLLVANLENRQFVKPMAEILENDPPWVGNFWVEAFSASRSLENTAQLWLQLHQQDNAARGFQDAKLIEALSGNGNYEMAEQIYMSLVMQEASNVVKNAQFSRPSTYPPLDWELSSTGEYGASIENGALRISAISNSGGRFARQLIRLPKRDALIEVKLDQSLQVNDELYLELTCAEKKRFHNLTSRIPINKKTIQQKISNSNSACHFYWLDLKGNSRNGSDGMDIAVHSITIG